jgi:spectinomycin phosphotransferase
MLDAPEGLTADQISSSVRTHWGIDPVAVTYAAVGHGSYNWIVLASDGSKWFVKAERAGADSAFLRATYETAAALHTNGLDCVHAAVRDRSGALRRPVSSAWEVGVFSFIEGRNPDFGGSTSERAQIAEAVGRLHAVPPAPIPT